MLRSKRRQSSQTSLTLHTDGRCNLLVLPVGRRKQQSLTYSAHCQHVARVGNPDALFSFPFTQFCFCAQNILRPTMPAASCDHHMCSSMSQSNSRFLLCVRCQERRRRRCIAQNNDPLAVGLNPIYTRNWFNSFTNKCVWCNCVWIVPAVLQHFNHKMYHHRVDAAISLPWLGSC